MRRRAAGVAAVEVQRRGEASPGSLVYMQAPLHTAYVGLGSNLDDPAAQVRAAFAALAAWPHSRLTGRSSLYGSKPFGPIAQPDFVNAVGRLETTLSPQRLLEALQGLEVSFGRQRQVRWGPRRIDLDLLLFDDLQLETALLSLPHPGIVERNFVLYPLRELAPELLVPGLARVAELARRVDPTGLWRLESDLAHDG